MRVSAILCAFVVWATSLAAPAAAWWSSPWAHIKLTQDISAGTWQLSIWASPLDNAGIAAYSIPLITPVTGLDHKSPRAGAAETPDGTLSGSVGFTSFRSADGTTSSAMTIAGRQDVIAPTPFIIYGFGQTAGSWQTVTNGPVTPLGSNEGNNWLAKPIIASGTFTPGSFVKIDRASVELKVYLFKSRDSLETVLAGQSPEPASAGMAMMALAAATAVRRRWATRR